ncbi:MAG TPA: PQQ-binding-like beta-propeller repeat protein [Verrucomicrobiae bacterium]|nr:PQQ-binding-like beta-propeller repeat protein [Verrucomicrobiae bacterium]
MTTETRSVLALVLRQVFVVFIPIICPHVSAGPGPERSDWPMWRLDAGHTAATEGGLPNPLRLRWKRDLPPPAPAFPNDPRLCFDRSYEPVVAGKRMFVPSMVTDSVTALDTESGEEAWTFFADGPVRFAPVAWRGRVYITSDDGSLYCVAAEDGRPVWKYSPVEPEYGACKFLGNERLISRWPARGGPVVCDGIIYFAAGIWPFEGVVVCAVDAETGKPLWVNKDCGWIKDGLLDHGTRRDGGLSPQGYLAVLGSRLVVPSGRALPAFFDRATGQMEPYTTGWGGRVALAKGSWYVCGIGEFMFQSGDLYRLGGHETGAAQKPGDYLSVGDFAQQMNVRPATVERWIDKYKLETATRDGELGLRVRNDDPITYLSWWTTSSKGAPMRDGERQALEMRPRLDIDPANVKELGIFREPVLSATAIYYSSPRSNSAKRFRDSNEDRNHPRSASYSAIIGCDLSGPPQWGATLQGGWGTPTRLVAWNTARFNRLWSLPSALKIHAKAGSRLYGGAPEMVAAVDLPTGGQKAEVSWHASIKGTPNRMLAANGKLFVVTVEGSIYCFGAEDAPTRAHEASTDRQGPSDDACAARAAEILQKTGTRDGYGVVLGPTSVRLLDELVRQSSLRLIVLEPDAEKIAAWRREFHRRGLYGTRIHILPGDLNSVRMPPYLATLVVAESSPESPGRLFDLLRPYGGIACLPLPADRHATFLQRVEAARLAGAEISRAHSLTILKRCGALSGAADWAHESGDAAHTFASRDQRVAPPFGVLWFSGELDRAIPWIEGDPPCLPGETAPSPFAGAGPRPRVAGGRMFVQIGDNLYATDIYTGRHLWTRSIESLGDYAAAKDSVFAVSGAICLRLDVASGETKASFPCPGGETWRQIRVSGDALVGTAGKRLLCLDHQKGAPRWEMASQRDGFGFAVAPDRVFCVDHWLPKHRREQAPETQEAEILAIDLATGRPLWRVRTTTPDVGAASKWNKYAPPLNPQLAYSCQSDVLLFTRNAATAAAYDGSSGRLLWAKEIPCKDPPSSFTSYHPPIILGERFITHAGEVLDISTGEPCSQRLWKGANVELRGCGRALACPRLVMMRDAHASYYDLATGAHAYLRGIRAGCTSSLIPADGLLTAPNYSRHCTCNYPVSVSFALVPMPRAPGWDGAPQMPAP